MNKTNQFSAKTQYVTPWCKSVELRSASTILTGSNNFDSNWHTEMYSVDEDEDL